MDFPNLVSLVQGLFPEVELIIQVTLLLAEQLLRTEGRGSQRNGGGPDAAAPPAASPAGSFPSSRYLFILKIQHLLLQRRLRHFYLL